MTNRGQRLQPMAAGALLFAAFACGGAATSSRSSPAFVDFVVAVGPETFVMRASDPETIRLARERLQGGNARFPSGPLLAGDGGFNAPWSWRLDPAETRMVEVSIEVCDGTPSYVEAHQADFPRYCPWSARIVRER